MPRRLGAELFGTFWLTFAGCGSAVIAAGLLLSIIGTASAQSYGSDRSHTREPDRPHPYYRWRFYQGPGYYRPGRYRTWNGCQRGWTVQGGLCKPYRGY